MSKPHEFAIYAGDDFIASGTSKELAEKLGVNPKWIRHMSTPTYLRRLAETKRPTGCAKYAVKLGVLEDDL